MNPVVYWRGALGLFWAFMFFVVLSLIIGVTYLSKLTFYPYAVFLSAILLIFLSAFLLFDKRVKVGFYMCITLSVLFVANQVLTLFMLFIVPSKLLPIDVFGEILKDESILFPAVVSILLLFWGLLLFAATWKSRPVFEKDLMQHQLKWLVQMKKEDRLMFKEMVKQQRAVAEQKAQAPQKPQPPQKIEPGQ